MTIPFTKITLGEEEIQAVADVIRSGWVVMGEKTKQFEEEFAKYVGAKHAIFVDSGTSALDLAVKYAKNVWGFGGFWVPSLTFSATAEVVVNNGLRLAWIDVDKETFCVNSPYVQTIQVHLAGRKADSLGIIEDSAHRIERDQCKDSQNIVCFSFYATKNLNTVQGGMIATNRPEMAAWLRKARDHGISQGTTERYKEGKWEYSIDFVGWREKSDDVHAAIGLEQLKKLDGINERRSRIVQKYNERFGLSRVGNHLYPLLVDDRPRFIKLMNEAGIQVSVHFLPLHNMPAYKKEDPGRSLPNTEYLGERMVSLPLFDQMTDEEVDYVVETAAETTLVIKE